MVHVFELPGIEEASPSLHRRIRELASDTEPIAFPSFITAETLEEQERCQAERHYLYALCRRTWWRLAPPERDVIRTIVLAEHPYYRTHPEKSVSFEMDCVREVARFLDESAPSTA
jgi:hypothetical protein